MNTLTLLIVLLCMVAVYARHVDEVIELDQLSSEKNDGVRNHGSDQNRHRRRRWQMNYGYDYPQPPPTHPYYPERRDFNREQDYLPQIVRLLEEILAYVKRPQLPPPPPQPIYIPYPVAYQVPQFTSCPDKKEKKTPNVTGRFPEMEDTNQNWGFVVPNEETDGEESDGARPISFDPIKPKRPIKRPAPKVEHGSVQGDSSTQAPNFSSDQPPQILRMPNMCNAAILSCCGGEKQQQGACFNGFGCGITFDAENTCSADSISAALDSFKTAYSPVQ